MIAKVLPAGIYLALLACTSAGVPASPPTPTPIPISGEVAPGLTRSPALTQRCANSIIDWIDFIQFGGITYQADRASYEHPLDDGDLGPEYGKVKVKYSDSVCDPWYRSKHGADGDAAFLEPGTPIYTMNGYKPEFRLVARRDDRLTLYVADTNPNAILGADLLDIGGKVSYIGVNSQTDGATELAAIKDPAQIEAMVSMVLDAPVDQDQRDHDGLLYFIAFHMNDGTTVVRAYWLDSGELSRGILLPDEFRIAVEEALQ